MTTTAMRRVRAAGIGAVLAAVAGCGAAESGDPAGAAGGGPPTARALASSPEAEARVASLRERFVVRPVAPAMPRPVGMPSEAGPGPQAVIGEDVARGFAVTATGLEPLVPPEVKRRGMKSATVELPLSAREPVTLTDDTSGMSVRFALKGAKDVAPAVAGGLAIYRGAVGGADVVHRVHAEGTEDFVVFEGRPEKEELAYDVDVSRVAGLRLVSETLEFLDQGGAPRLRVAPPYVVSADGTRSEARIEVDGCALDRDPRAPWGRPATVTGSGTCTMAVRWRAPVYPVAVDPSWATTGSMSAARMYHTASALPGAKILVAGGIGTNSAYLASAEIYDPVTAVFGATGPMSTSRTDHSAATLSSGKVLVAGGYTCCANLASGDLYDPGKGTFAMTGSMSVKRNAPVVLPLANGGAVVGGGSDGSVYSSAEVYSPATNAFSLGNSLTAPRRDPAVAQLSNGKYLVAGGDSGGGVVVASAELFDPATGVFLPTGKMSVPRVHAAAVPLGNGRALLAAGANVLGAEVFDAAKGTFAPAGSLLASRQWPIGAPLPGGDALIAGGMDDVGNPLATAERFDSATAQFVAAGAMQWERAYATAMALPSGLVFVTGGGGGFPMPFSELFDASTCTTDTNFCPADSYCAADGACKLRKVLGSACNLQQNADCKVANCRACAGAGNGNCVDGVCCDSACAGACDSCNQASKVGTCTPAPKGDPGNNPACVSNLCDGVLVTCPTTCASDGDCVAADYCSKATNKCTPRLGNGLKCDESAAGDCKVPGCHLCASGNCVNGYCCDSACGPCGSCSQVPGTCTPKAHGIAPDNPGCGEYYCDGVHGSCPANCVNVSDCKPGDSCVSGVCGTTFPNGTACVSAAQCTTGNCADGVCCNDPCVGTCQACSAKLKQSGADDGLCGPATVGTNPRQMCKDDGKECGKRAACAGDSESCAFVAQGTKCGAGPHCSTGDVVDTQCDGQGTCGEITKDACAPYQCQSAACTKPCAGDGDCVDGYFCKSKTCVKRSKNGDQCGDSSECLSKHCSPDGVCCNEACSGQCESCIESGQNGVCVAVAGEPRKGHGDCGSGECRGTCKPGDRTQCAYPGASLKCGDASSCSGNVVHARGVCTNDGTCDVPDAKPCPGSLRCDEVNGICKTACDTSADCISGSSCNTETHECAPTNGTCADTFTKKLPDGSTASCMGYRCNAGECASTCAKASECDVDNGYTCASGQCTKAGAAQPASGGSGDSGASGGCGVARGTSGRGDGYSVMLGMMALALVAARRRRAA